MNNYIGASLLYGNITDMFRSYPTFYREFIKIDNIFIYNVCIRVCVRVAQ